MKAEQADERGEVEGVGQRSWCYAHRLELACKDTFSSPIQEMLLRLYYLYEESPKESRELDSIVDNLKEVF